MLIFLFINYIILLCDFVLLCGGIFVKKKKVYTVATAHLDTIWSWDFETSVKEYLFNTLKDNFKRFEQFPEYKFNFEGAYRYELMKEYYPEMWDKMKEYISKGRWNVCGSAYENGDVNVPSPEALFRNILLGNKYFEDNFGKRSCDIFLPDCFGFGYALPSIMHHANLKGFSTQKLTWGSAYGVPFDIGKWYGVDGNYVYACTNLGSYTKVLPAVRKYNFVLDKLKENEKFGLDMTAVYHGVGDRGGAPKEASVKVVCDELKKNSENDITVISAVADEIYRDLDNMSETQKQKLPVWNNELVMTNHAVGGYTSRAIGKRWNRRNEELADITERACIAAYLLSGHEYPQETLNKAWKRVIAHQFHDDLPGTSVQRAYRRSWNDYAMSLNQFTAEYCGAVRSLSDRLDSSFCEGIGVLVQNPLEYDRTGLVKIRIPAKLCYKNMTAFDADGNELPTQTVECENSHTTLLVYVSVSAMGGKIIDIRFKMPTVKSDLRASIQMLENEKYIVEINSNGDISSVFDKELKKEILQKPIVTGIFDYNGSSSWPAWELNYNELNREPQHIAKVKSIDIIEQGSCRVALKIVKAYENSTFTSVVALSRGGKLVEVYTEAEWQSRQSACKEIFSFTTDNYNATYDLGLGAIKRGNMNEKLFEVPAQKWADITDESEEFGVSVISECKYGWDKFDNSTLRLTLMHTPLKNYKIDSMQSMLDLGLNRYSYGIFAHKGNVGHETQCVAREFTMPMVPFIVSKHSGNFGTELSVGRLTGNAILRAVKKAESGNEIIIRVGESEKKEQKNVEFEFFSKIKSAREVFASEEHIRDVELNDGKLVFDLKPYEVKSFALTVECQSYTEPNQLDVVMPTNITAFSTNTQPRGDLPVINKTIPCEITPKTVYANGVHFKIPQDRKALLCGGQTLIMPTGTKKVHLLAASLNGDKIVQIGNSNVRINDIREYYAGWDLYDFNEVAFTKHGKLGYEFTHSHTKDGDAQCEQLFFWKVTVAHDGGKITLPVDRDIIILAVTADGEENTCSLACDLYDKVRGRRFDYQMSKKDRINYLLGKELFMLNDKGGAFKNRNKGRRN